MQPSGHSIRLRCRQGDLHTPTAGLAPGYVQANLIVLPSEVAGDFQDLCARNPVPCPLIGSSKATGDPCNLIPDNLLAKDLDIRTDLPKYNVYQDGKLVAIRKDLLDDWAEDHVAFLIGCSFSFEAGLIQSRLTPRHIEQNRNVSMYKTSLLLSPAGIFDNSTWVVSMRPYKPEDIDRVREVTRPFLKTHGEPVAWGWDACRYLGISDLRKPDFGDAVDIEEGEVPVFWGCGVTPQIAVIAAGGRIKGKVLGHSPGHMLLLDVAEDEIL